MSIHPFMIPASRPLPGMFWIAIAIWLACNGAIAAIAFAR